MFMLAKRQTPIFIFAVSSLSIYAADTAIARSALFNAKPHLLSVAVLIDLTLVVPLLYYACVIRAGRAPFISIAPLVLLGCAVASIALPAAASRDYLQRIKYLAALPELLIVGYLFIKARQTWQSYPRADEASGDFVDRLRFICRGSLGEHVLAEVFVSELAMLYYAFFSWRARPPVLPAQTLSFSYHKKSGWAAILAALLIIITTESFVTHYFIQKWSSVAAWLLSALSVYCVVWLVGDYRAMCLRPIYFDEEALYLRQGLRWSARIPLCSIERIEVAGLNNVRQSAPDYFRAVALGEPDFFIVLKEVVVADGIFGLKKRFRQAGVSVDESQLFAEKLSEHIKSSQHIT